MHRQDNTYHGLCYTSRGALAGTRNSFLVCDFNVCLRLVDVLGSVNVSSLYESPFRVDFSYCFW